MNKKVLVTGANGQLGKTIEELYSINDASLEFTFVSKENLDITNEGELLLYFKANKFDYCINCAAYTNVEQAEKTPEIAYRVNAEAVKNLAESCKENNITLIHISTDYVFDGEKIEPYELTDVPNPINEYGKSKLLGEQYIQRTLEKYFIIRTSWLYSKKYSKNFYKSILEKVKVENELFITDEQIGCPTNTENLADFIIKIIIVRISKFGLYHFCDEKAMTWYDFANQVLFENYLLDKIKLVKSNSYRTFAKRPKNSVLINSKLS
ncbi:dTDP-4-dehydrorhamnose reductase [Mariniflexile fucanivorans]|uniref:dTDP-4-dehydrorhamnose reductase n=1 Tax=Mariniflexile fucanivorans TaxID=264023 RepID=A0A4R1RSE7_9FLAO|nr:dTDP-4-dehydrorhamnose reductase [Mariniflexile fucanivorans]TCL69239.1 dTDP-4-dehydrorhamnose reductase [Mariniflexile fucanivorans]